LLRHCWKATVTISMPRIRPCAGEFQALTHMTDRDLAQLVCAFRIMFPDVGLVLSTRETPALRDGLIPLGITMISAGSHTEPGGYTGAGRENLHAVTGTLASGHTSSATSQFAIADERSAAEVAQLVRRLGYEPVWKDWDAALTA
jgi:2-iminoacetate synthase